MYNKDFDSVSPTYQIIVDRPHCSLGGVVLVIPGRLVDVPGAAVNQDGHGSASRRTSGND